MANIDRFRDHLRSEKDVPEGLLWDDMQDSILAGLEPQGQTRPKWWVWFVLGMILVLTLGGIYVRTDAEEQLPTHNTASINQEENAISTTKTNQSIEKTKHQIENTTLSTSIETSESAENATDHLNGTITISDAGTIKNKGIDPTNESLTQAEASTKDIASSISKRPNNTRKETKAPTTKSTDSNTNFTTKDRVLAEASLGTSELKQLYAGQARSESMQGRKSALFSEEDNVPQRKLLDIQDVPVLLYSVIIQAPARSLGSHYMDITIPKTVQPTDKDLAIGFHVGSNYWRTNRNGSTGLHERPLVGLTADLALTKAFNKYWSIGTGIRYRQLRSRLDYYAERDTLVTIQQARINTITGARDSVDVVTDAIAWRQVQHLNETELVTIPLVIQYTGATGAPLNWTTSAGIEYTIGARQSGRYLLDQQGENGFLAPADLSGGPYDKVTDQLSATIAVGLDYLLYDHVSLTTRISGNQQLGSWSSQETSRPILVDCVAGLQYRF